MARLNDLLTRAVIIWSTSITTINSIELYNLSAAIGGVVICVGISKWSVASSLSHSLLYFALHSLSFIRHPSPLSLPGTRRPGLGEVISRIGRDDELSLSFSLCLSHMLLPLFYRTELILSSPDIQSVKKNICKPIMSSQISAFCHDQKRILCCKRKRRKVKKKDSNMGRELELALQI